jgi:hypothetical protein
MMKTLNLKLIFCLLTISFIGCAAVNESVKTAERVNLYTSETESVLLLEPGAYIQEIQYAADFSVKTVDVRKTGWGEIILPPGGHTLQVQYASGNTYSEPILMSSVFSPGKRYRLYYTIYSEVTRDSKGAMRFFIEERLLNDDELDYLAFSRENPHYLEGVWAFSKSYPYEDMEITFEKNRFRTATFNRVSEIRSVTEGIYFFNEDTVILYYEKLQEKDVPQRDILFYELKDGILYVKSGGNAAVITIGGLEGEYTKR